MRPAAEPGALLVGGPAAGELAATLARQGIVPVHVAPDEAPATLSAAVQGGHPPAICVLMGLHADPLALVRDLRRRWAGGMLLACPPDRLPELRRQLSYTPMLGPNVTLLDESDPALAGEIVKAVQAEARGRQLRTTLQRANAALASMGGTAAGNFQRLASAERYLTRFLEKSAEAIAGLDPQDRVLYWNDAAARLLGLPTREARGRNVHELPFWNADVQRVLADLHGGAEHAVAEVQRAPGAQEGGLPVAVLEVAVSAITDEHGTYAGAMLLLRDVSERHRQLALERSRSIEALSVANSRYRHLATLFDRAPGFLAVTRGPDHVFELANRAYLATFGSRDLLDRSMHDAFPELRDQAFVQIRDTVYRTGEPYIGRDVPVSVRLRPGSQLVERFLDFVYQPLTGKDGRVWGIFCQGNDVTEQKRMRDQLLAHQNELERLVAERTAELQSAQAALHHAQKLEAIGKLTGGVAHDFNNILQILHANLELLAQEPGVAGAGDAARRVDSAMAAVDRGTKLTAQLLAFARRQPLRPEPVDLAVVVRGLDDLLHRALGEAIDIGTVVEAGLWATLADRTQMENVLLNLAINARDAMAGTGRLTIELGNVELDSDYAARQEDLQPGQYVMLAVSDTGHGMTPDVLARAVEPFFTTKPEGEGTGLGLSMTYGFMKQSGGHLKIYSEPGKGTSVKLFLPRTLQVPVTPAEPTVGAVHGGHETVLVVEDDADVRAVVTDALGKLGYKVLQAAHPEAALAILQSGARIDLLFTDVVMPGTLRSPELARLATTLLPGIAVLFTSGYTQNAIVHAGRLDPGVELLSKPYSQQQLALRVRQVLDHRPAATAAAPSPAPVPDSAPASAPVPASAEAPGAPARPRVLVVEDNADGRELLCEMLDLLGCDATGAATAEDALPLLAAADILLTDISLPGMPGIDLARQAHGDHPRLRIVFASGGTPPDVTFPSAAIRKPFSMAQLEEIIKGGG
ncbi:response regulator [Pseudoduganella lutea]|uniref:histidine kinase n=1 Tax=Pseudoduganella lutea TaxID=321985 RepID=A0A4P6L5I5_9BURK|nr:response regulator [Pseudoduganella lutea]QBE66724.1 response regulator [Pseudoduganella lutea]